MNQKSWTVRWFVLSKSGVAYFDGPGSKSTKGEISLSDIIGISHSNDETGIKKYVATVSKDE